MDESLSPEKRGVVQEVLRYLSRHPEAGDTLEHIAKWWLPVERLLPKLEVLEETLAYLVAQGVVTETVLPGGEKFYKVTPDQRTKIAQLIQTAESGGPTG